MQILSIVFLKMQWKRHCLRQRFILCAQKGTNAREDTFIHILGCFTLNPWRCKYKLHSYNTSGYIKVLLWYFTQLVTATVTVM